MTLNTVKPRSAIRRLSPSMVWATDVLLGFGDDPVRRLRAVWHQASFRREAQLRPAARAGRCLILVQKCALARGERFIHLRAAPRPHVFDRITVADAPNRDQGVRPTRR
jgi:hypothetical protein